MKPKILKLIPLILLIIPLVIGCSKEHTSDVEDVDGILLFYGRPATDGCGWIVKINEIEYSPINLDPNYNKDSTAVTLSYDTLQTTWHCGWREEGYRQIKINEIAKKK